MRVIVVTLVAAFLVGGSADARVQNARQRRQLQQQVVERLLENGRVQAGLNDEQFGRYREIARRSLANRNEMQRRERELWQALEGQMRPGVAADEDSVVALLDSLEVFPERRIRAVHAERKACMRVCNSRPAYGVDYMDGLCAVALEEFLSCGGIEEEVPDLDRRAYGRDLCFLYEPAGLQGKLHP